MFILFLFAIANSFAQSVVYVQGYTRSNGTYVQGYYRTAPNSTTLDNYSTKVIIILIFPLVATVLNQYKSIAHLQHIQVFTHLQVHILLQLLTLHPFILHLHTELQLIPQFIQDQEVVLITLILMEIKLI